MFRLCRTWFKEQSGSLWGCYFSSLGYCFSLLSGNSYMSATLCYVAFDNFNWIQSFVVLYTGYVFVSTITEGNGFLWNFQDMTRLFHVLQTRCDEGFRSRCASCSFFIHTWLSRTQIPQAISSVQTYETGLFSRLGRLSSQVEIKYI